MYDDVLVGCANRISEEGLYIESGQPATVGSEVAFEMRVRDGFTVLRGEGEIVQATGEGVFLRVAYLDQPSLKLLPKILAHYRRQGVPLLELPEVEGELPEAAPGEVVEKVREELDREHEGVEIEQLVSKNVSLENL